MPPKAGPTPCANCFPTRRRWMHGSRAGRPAPRPKRPRRNARRRCGGSILRIIPRNHRVEEALDAASSEGDLRPFEDLLKAIQRPCDEDPALARYAEPAPGGYTDSYRTFCGT
jgi:uncharacterized protein YdiU (UPF0061 family)